MEPKIINFNTNYLFGSSRRSIQREDIPEGLCQFSTPINPILMGLDNPTFIYYKNYGLINFAFGLKSNGTTIYIGHDYARGCNFFNEDRKSYMLVNVLGEDLFRASKEDVLEIFIDKRHHMSDWLLFNQELWAK